MTGQSCVRSLAFVLPRRPRSGHGALIHQAVLPSPESITIPLYCSLDLQSIPSAAYQYRNHTTCRCRCQSSTPVRSLVRSVVRTGVQTPTPTCERTPVLTRVRKHLRITLYQFAPIFILPVDKRLHAWYDPAIPFEYSSSSWKRPQIATSGRFSFLPHPNKNGRASICWRARFQRYAFQSTRRHTDLHHWSLLSASTRSTEHFPYTASNTG